MTDIDLVPFIIVVLLSFVIERVLAVIYDLDVLDGKLKVRLGREPASEATSVKGLIAAAISIVICLISGLDVINAILKDNAAPIPAWIGEIMTGLVIAGGSQGSVKLFQDVLGFSKKSRDEIKKTQSKLGEAQRAQAEQDKASAELKTLQTKQELQAMEARQALIPSLAPIGGPDISIGPPLSAPTPFSDADQNILIEALPNPQDRADLHLRRLKARRDQTERLTFLRRYGPKLEDFGDIASIEDLVEKASQRRIAGG